MYSIISFSVRVLYSTDPSLHKQMHEKSPAAAEHFLRDKGAKWSPTTFYKIVWRQIRAHCHSDCCTVRTNMDTASVSAHTYIHTPVQNFSLGVGFLTALTDKRI